jgi:uncharacterized RDD family membrane protein YckC
MGDWTDRLRQETTTRTLAEVEAPDAGLICTENEVLFLNANGLQRAPLSEITKVSRDGPDLVLAGGTQTFVRGAIGADKLSLANFFAEVKQAVAQARSKREVLLDTTPATLTSAPTTMSISSSPANQPPETNLGRTQTPPPYPGMAQPPVESQSVFSSPPAAPSMTPQMSAAPRLGTVAATETSATAFQPAGFWWRVLAYIIDGLVVGTVGFVLLLILGLGSVLSLVTAINNGSTDPSAAASSIVGLIGTYLFWSLLVGIGSWLYYALLESSERQATLGKMATGLFVSNLDGGRISFGQASGRYWSKIGVSIALGLIVGLVSVPFRDGAIAGLLQLVYYAGILYTYIMCALTPRKQTLYDQISGSVVWKR